MQGKQFSTNNSASFKENMFLFYKVEISTYVVDEKTYFHSSLVAAFSNSDAAKSDRISWIMNYGSQFHDKFIASIPP